MDHKTKLTIDYRAKEMLEMKKQNKTNVEIGKKFGISDERVRQIIGNFGHLGVVKIKIRCPVCKKVNTYYKSGNRKYCSLKCSRISHRLNSKKPITEYTKEEMKVVNKKRNDGKRELRKLYYQKPEVKQRLKEYRKTEIYKNYHINYYKNNKNKNHGKSK